MIQSNFSNSIRRISQLNQLGLFKPSSYADKLKNTSWYAREVHLDTPLSGYADGDKSRISIWGKLKGLDESFGKEQVDDLKKFIDESGALALGLKWNLGDKKIGSAYSVDETIEALKDSELQVEELKRTIFFHGRDDTALLDSDMGVDEFKQKWAQYALKKRFGVELNDDDAKNAIEILKELSSKNMPQKESEKAKFKPIQAVSKSVTYKYEASSDYRQFYEFIEREFNGGKNIFEILKKVAENRVDKLA
ncbi:hypothetical protein [Campylobacter sp. 19-13652]|uniref:hypothetical protein n=1 Tax=Campylobacter sp. 19-13652 TaxID=2840180 RepID=UPI001C77FC03|nr:hypothetical protein [Campylobacter sp. 19-13652]BCX78643.1 hypothetical protein LBC_01050 [Campylobacter sp. 19-13652]